MKVIDTTGKACPVPILELAKAIRQVGEGTIVELVSTDPAVSADLRAWCEATGNELVGIEEEGKLVRAKVRKAGRSPSAGTSKGTAWNDS